MREILVNALEFMLTFDKMQNTSPLMCTKFEIWGKSILKVIQAFHTIRTVLYIGSVVEYLNKINMLQSTTWSLTRTPDVQNYNYAYSMKSLNNFQNAPASDFNFFHIKVQSNLGYPNADYPKLLGYSKGMDSPDFFLYYLLQ